VNKRIKDAINKTTQGSPIQGGKKGKSGMMGTSNRNANLGKKSNNTSLSFNEFKKDLKSFGDRKQNSKTIE